MNLRLVEDGKEAMSRGDWMLALSLFEQSRRICIDEGWREGVHYADDMILDIYPMAKRQIDENNRAIDEKRYRAARDISAKSIPNQQSLSHPETPAGMGCKEDTGPAESHGIKESDNTKPIKDVFDEDPANRRLRRMINVDKEE
jgi:hypothetical protein